MYTLHTLVYIYIIQGDTVQKHLKATFGDLCGRHCIRGYTLMQNGPWFSSYNAMNITLM